MKYIVMECHPSYSVLMDEESAFHKAANLNYEVGQTVENPILMNENDVSGTRNSIVMKSILAAAACLVLIFGAGYGYYSSNLKTYSTIRISAQSDYMAQINKKGEVISISSNSEEGKKILSTYDGKGKDKVTVAYELIQLEKENGSITENDVVEVYISDDDNSEFKSELIQKSEEMNLNVNISEGENKPSVPPAPHENKPEIHKTSEPPKPLDKPDSPVTPPIPKEEKNEHLNEVPPTPPHELNDNTPPSPHLNESEIKKPSAENIEPPPPPLESESVTPPPHENKPPIPHEEINEKPVPPVPNEHPVE